MVKRGSTSSELRKALAFIKACRAARAAEKCYFKLRETRSMTTKDKTGRLAWNNAYRSWRRGTRSTESLYLGTPRGQMEQIALAESYDQADAERYRALAESLGDLAYYDRKPNYVRRVIEYWNRAVNQG